MDRMIFLHGALEILRRGVHFVRLEENFRGAAPDHDGAVDFVFLLEFADVVVDLHREIVFVFGFLDVRAVEILDVILIEGGLHGLDAVQEWLNLGEMIRVEHAGVRGGFVGGVGENIPAAENDVVQAQRAERSRESWACVLRCACRDEWFPFA